MWKFQLNKMVEPRVRTRESLPTPPEGMEWEQNRQSKQWRLVKTSTAGRNAASAFMLDRPPLVPLSSAQKQLKTSVAHPEILVDRLPSLGSGEEKIDEDDWDLLSEQVSMNSLGGAVVVMNSGSVRSITSRSIGDGSASVISIPFRLQRTPSSSTIGSEDASFSTCLVGVDYVEHIVVPSDTLQGICLTYKISAARLRQANQFTGDSLAAAPKKLIVPLSKKAVRSGFVKVQDQNSQEYKIHAFLAELSHLKEMEALAYLEMADWHVEDAIRSARDDVEWEKECEPDKGGDIQISVKLNKGGLPVDVQTTGAGLAQPKSVATKPVSYDALPAIATKNVRPQDVYDAAAQHQGYGLELKSLDENK